MKCILILILFIFSIPLAYAENQIAEETSVGSTHFIQSVWGGGDFGASGDQAAPWNWNVGYTYEKSSTPNLGGEVIVDNTNDFNGDIDWRSESGWGVGLFLDISSTPAENLSARGGAITGSYKWTYGTGELEFHPYLLTKLNLASNTYKVTFAANTPFRRVANKGPRTGEVSIVQKMIGPEVVWRPWDQWRFNVAANVYGYSRDVAEFESQLDSQAALRLGLDGFSNTVGGLPKAAFTLAVNWYFNPDWDLYLRQDVATAADDGSKSGTSKISVEYVINNDWRAHLGSEIYTSTVLSDTLFIAGIEYDL